MSGYDPLEDHPPTDGSLRYPPMPNGRYDIDPGSRRGEATAYRSLPFTLEEETYAGGWLPGATPTCGPDAPPLQRLMTVGMRGEPAYDDDPAPAKPFNNRYANDGGEMAGSSGHD